ncbi:uncharacterized protein N7479_004700 [Penicillium vulpinum]|uniref:Uncharacterized protein n=1 Tax=Penicillium vulpinum TaxID=29845 RepID=A0A1V6RLW4_9EURO|nr:uncharacterized protein N7479_004700 [Penicillium vulpinum]KAJ5964824.1 hypothetical protein N7479_004700 [Penicillium vulpinum]OQE02841.1 hypothetical protein PENVUL_c038G08801 [Penicillium vulpinum]
MDPSTSDPSTMDLQSLPSIESLHQGSGMVTLHCDQCPSCPHPSWTSHLDLIYYGPITNVLPMHQDLPRQTFHQGPFIMVTFHYDQCPWPPPPWSSTLSSTMVTFHYDHCP